MGNINQNQKFARGDEVTSAKLNNIITTASVMNLQNGDFASNCSIPDSKLATILTTGKINTSALTTTNKAAGDFLYNTGTAWARLPVGTAGQRLQVSLLVDLMEYADNAAARAAYVNVDEDFTGYTEQDANGRITESASKVTVVNANSNEDVYLYKDYGVNYFNALNVNFELYCTNEATSPNGRGGIAFSNTLDDTYAFAATDIWVNLSSRGSNVAWLRIGRGADAAVDYYIGSSATLYYCTLSRVAGNDNANVYIYSDSARLTLLDTITIAGVGTGTKWRYAFGFNNANTGDVRLFNGYVQNMDLQSLQSYSEATIKTQGSYSLKGIAAITDSLNKTLTRTVSPIINLTGINTLKFDIYAGRTGANIKIGIHDSGGTTSEKTYTVVAANTWETVTWDISAVSDANKDAIDSIIVTILNADAANTFYLDNWYVSLPALRWVTP